MMINSYWGSLLSRWLPWLQSNETPAQSTASSSKPMFTGSRKALERYLNPVLENLFQEIAATQQVRCFRCNSGNIDTSSRRPLYKKAIMDEALDSFKKEQFFLVDLEALEQQLLEEYKRQEEANPVLCRECLKKQQTVPVRVPNHFPDLSVYKTSELKLGPNLVSSGPVEANSSISELPKKKKRIYFSEAQFQEFEKMKIGRLVQDTLPQIIENNNLSEATMLDLLSVARSKKIFDVNFPVLKKVDRNTLIDVGKDDNGYSRYYSRSVKWKGSEYLITSQWYRDSHRRYLKWLRKMAYREGL